MKIDIDDYEVTYEFVEAAAAAIDEQAASMVDEMVDLPDAVAHKLRALAAKQAVVLRQAVAEVAKYDIAMLRELGEDVERWAVHHPRLVREELDLASALQQGMASTGGYYPREWLPCLRVRRALGESGATFCASTSTLE